MAKGLVLLLCVAFTAILQLSQARVKRDLFKSGTGTQLEVADYYNDPEPILNRICHCESSSCSCCVREFRKRICVALDFIEKIGEGILHVRVHVNVNDRQVISQIISTESIPPICYANMPIGLCVKLNVKNTDRIEVCATLQLKLFGKVKKEQNLYCLTVHKSY